MGATGEATVFSTLAVPNLALIPHDQPLTLKGYVKAWRSFTNEMFDDFLTEFPGLKGKVIFAGGCALQPLGREEQSTGTSSDIDIFCIALTRAEAL